MFIDRGVDKEDVVHMNNGILLSHKNQWNNVICSDMDDLKIMILSEISQTEKDK